jgi:LPXTG-motif cell wall-anchored protein
LPATGSDVNAMLATALVILTAGTVLLAVDRRRLRRIRP